MKIYVYPIFTAILIGLFTVSLQGQQLVKNINAGVADAFSGSGSFTDEIINVNGLVYFKADDGVHGPELWKSDGTEAGTVLVKDINSGASGSSPYYLTNWNGVLYFIAYTETHEAELWKSDGTEAGTQMVKDINPNGSGVSAFIGSLGNALFFQASDGNSGSELWKTDGTAAGTVQVKDINPGSNGSIPKKLDSTPTLLFFTADDGTHGLEIWASDGTEAGTKMTKDIAVGSGGLNMSGAQTVGDLLFFGASTNFGWELWKSDGIENGTSLVKDACEGGCSILPQWLTNLNGTLIFEAGDNFFTNRELWKSNGTPESTGKITEINAGNASALSVSNPRVANGLVFFSANNGTDGKEPWCSDGTAANTKQLKNIAAGNTGSSPGDFCAVGDLIFFTANDGINGEEMWVTRGTAASTQMLSNIHAGSNSATPYRFAKSNGLLFFVANDGVNGNELWKIDPATLHVPLPNNDCANAVAITPNNGSCSLPSIYSNTNATNSNQNPSPTCANYNGADVWFTFTMPLNGQLFLETSNAGGLQNTGMEVYSGTCGNLATIACDADAGADNFSKIEINGYGGQQLYARVWSENNQASGDFAFCAYGTPTTGIPICDKMQTVNCGTVIRGDYNDLQNNVPLVCGNVHFPIPELVFKYAPTEAKDFEIIVDYARVNNVPADVYISVMSACDATSCITNYNGNRLKFRNWSSDLYIVISFPSPQSVHTDYTILFSCDNQPGSNACQDAVPLTVGENYHYNGDGSKVNDNWLGEANCPNGGFPTVNLGQLDRTHQFTLNQTTTVTIDFDANNNSAYAAVFFGCALNAPCLENTLVANNPMVLPNLSPGTYTVLVESLLFPELTYDLLVSDLDCSSAATISCGTPISGTTLGKSNDVFQNNCNFFPAPDVLYKYEHSFTGDINISLSTDVNTPLEVAIFNNCNTSSCLAFGTLGVNYAAAPAGTYYILVDGNASNEADNFTLTIDCPDNCLPVVATNTTRNLPIPDTTKAANTISSTDIIEANANVTYIAGQSITLQANFHAKANATFKASIENMPCEATSPFTNSSERTQKTALLKEDVLAFTESSLTVFPNPFTNLANIQFNLPESSTVQVNLYNLSGQLVKTVFPHTLVDKGPHQLKLTAKHLNPGVYFLSLQTATERLTRKLILK